MISFRVYRTKEFDEWFEAQTKKDQGAIANRLGHIEEFHHFGDCKNLG